MEAYSYQFFSLRNEITYILLVLDHQYVRAFSHTLQMREHQDEMVRESKNICSVVIETEGMYRSCDLTLPFAEQETDAQSVTPGQTFSH